MRLTGDSHPSVAIIGAGWSGLACALKLAHAGFKPVVFESAPEVGGRARRAKFDDVWRDNGQHLMLSGCHALTALLGDIGIMLPQVPFAYTDGQRTLTIPVRSGRARLLLALLRAKGFHWQERWALLRALISLQRAQWQVPADQTVTQWLEAKRQPTTLINGFWAPLALAILNTPIDNAAMTRLAPVLRDTLGADRDALAILQPSADLTASILNPLVAAIEAAGGQVLCGQRVTAVQRDTAGAYTVSLQHTDATLTFDHVVLAVPPWSLPHIELPIAASELASRFGAQPIATVYLGYDTDVRLPTSLVQLPGPTATDACVWAMDRAHCGEPGVMAVSLSADGPWTALDHELLALRCAKHLQALVGDDATLRWHKVVTVHRATPGATPNAILQAGERQPHPGLWLTGDWTHAQYPATLEAAVQTGYVTAFEIIHGVAQ